MDPTVSDAELMQRFRNGDEEAFHQLFSRQLDQLERRLARRIPPSLQRRFDVSDVIQETRVVAFEKRDRFEARGSDAFRRWVQGIGDHKLSEAIRRHGRTARRAAFREVTRGRRLDTQAAPAVGPTPSQVAMSREAETRVRRVLEQLEPDHREVIRLIQEAGLSLDEVAELMGRSRDAVRMLHRRAVSRFGALYDCGEGNPDA